MPKKLLFLCRHNINRSRVAEVIARVAINKKGFNAQVSSAGLCVDSYRGNAHPLILRELNIKGYDTILSDARKQVTHRDLQDSDLILTMSPDQKETLHEKYNFDLAKSFTLPQYARNTGDNDSTTIDEPSRFILDTTSPRVNINEYQLLASRAGRLPLAVSNIYLWLVASKVDSRNGTKIKAMYRKTVDQIERYINKAVDRMEEEGFFK